jgi:DNA-binding MarR family transcriptional regulator
VKNESVVLELQRATHATLHRLATELVALDLTASEINALGNLADGAARTVSQLGAAVGARPATLTGILDRLENRGLITRGARPGDRRAVVIELTADGTQAAAQIRQVLRALEKRALAGIPVEAVAAARTVLRALAQVER